jgi:hypothetical protein
VALKNWHASGIKVSVWSNSSELCSAEFRHSNNLVLFKLLSRNP